MKETPERRLLRLETVELMARAVAHELNNLSGIISSYSSFLRQDLSGSAGLLDDLEPIEQAGLRCASLALRLVSLSTYPDIRPSGVTPGMVLPDMKTFLQRILGRDIRLEIDAGEHLMPLPRGKAEFEIILINTAFEARSRLPEGGRLLLKLRPGRRAAEIILVADVEGFPCSGQSKHEEGGPWGLVRIRYLLKQLGWSMKESEGSLFEIVMS